MRIPGVNGIYSEIDLFQGRTIHVTCSGTCLTGW